MEVLERIPGLRSHQAKRRRLEVSDSTNGAVPQLQSFHNASKPKVKFKHETPTALSTFPS